MRLQCWCVASRDEALHDSCPSPYPTPDSCEQDQTQPSDKKNRRKPSAAIDEPEGQRPSSSPIHPSSASESRPVSRPNAIKRSQKTIKSPKSIFLSPNHSVSVQVPPKVTTITRRHERQLVHVMITCQALGSDIHRKDLLRGSRARAGL